MPQQENITTVYKLDISEFKKGIADANQEIKLANAQFNAATAGMEDWEKSTEGLEAKITQLTSVVEAQIKKLNNYTSRLESMRDVQDKNADVASKLRTEIEKATSEYGEGSDEVKKLEKQLSAVEQEMTSNEKAMKNLEVTILNQQASVSKAQKELGNFEDALKEVKSTSDKAEDSVDDLEDGFTVLKGSLASLIADGIRSFVSSIVDAIAETKEFRKEMSLLKEVADENKVSFDQAQDSYKKLLATRGDEGAVTETLNNLLTAGFDASNLDAITSGVEGLAIRFKDTLSQEGIADSIQEWIGSDGASLTGNFAEALERMGYSLEDVTEATKGMTKEQRQQWVISLLEKEGLMELSASYRENNKAAIEASNAQFELTNAISKFAAVVEPVVTAVKSGFAELLNTLFGLGSFDLTPFTEGIKTAFSTLTGLLTGELTIGQLIESGAKWISSLGEGLKSNIPELISKGLEMLDNFVDMLGENIPKLLESGIEFIRNIVKGLMDALPELIAKVPEIISKFANLINDNAPTIIKAGFGIILDIISGIINAIPTLIANIPKIITAIVDVWEAFNWLDLGKKAITLLKDGITSMIGAVKTAATSVKDNVVDAIKNLPTTLKTYGTNMMTNFSGAISSAVTTVKSKATEIYNAVVNGIKGLPEKMLGIGKDLVRGLWNGISDMTGWVINKIKGFSESVLDGIKDFFGVHSPSDETAWIGDMLVLGLGNSIIDGTKQVVSAAKDMANAVLSELHSDLDEIKIDPKLVGKVNNGIKTLNGGTSGGLSGITNASTSQVINFNQTINSPKAIDRQSLYRDTNALMFSAKARLKHV